MANPCCCVSPKIGTIIFAITEGVFNGIVFLTLIFVGIIVIHPDNLSDAEEISSAIICMVAIIACLCQVLLAFELGQAAKNDDYRRCLRWLIISIILLLISIVNVSLQFTLMTKELDLPFGVVGIIRIAFKLYGMLVVVSYTRTIRKTDNFCGSTSPGS